MYYGIEYKNHSIILEYDNISYNSSIIVLKQCDHIIRHFIDA